MRRKFFRMHTQEPHGTTDLLPRTSNEALRQMRANAGITQRELARRSGVSKSHISAIERDDTHPSADVVVRIATTISESYR